MDIDVSGLSRASREGEHGEDLLLLDTETQLFAVADGASASGMGHLAAEMLCQVLRQDMAALMKQLAAERARLPVARERVMAELRRSIGRANTAIFEKGLTSIEHRGLGTTVVACQLVGPSAVIAHVGNSRVYMTRGRRLFCLTQDHTVFQELTERGLLTPEQAVAYPYKEVLSRSVGTKPAVDVDLMVTDVAEDDRMILCSDGLTSLVGDGEILRLLSSLDPADAAQQLIALAGNGNDDATAVVLRFWGVIPEVNVLSIERKVAHLKKVFLFADLDFQEVLRVLEVIHETWVPEGEPIVREGESGDEFFVIGIGTALVSSHGCQLTRLVEGDHFGEMALLGGGLRSATVTAETDAVVLSIRADDLGSLISQSPRLANKLLWRLLMNLSARVKSLTEAVSGKPDA